jgi:hypothetical protein
VAAPAAPALEPDAIYLVEGDQLRKLETVPLDKDRSVGGFGALASVALMSDVTGAQFWGVLSVQRASSGRPTWPRFRVRMEKAKAMSLRLGKFAVCRATAYPPVKATPRFTHPLLI